MEDKPYATRVPAGPGVRLIASELRSAYAERPSEKPTMGHTAGSTGKKQEYLGSKDGAAPGTSPYAASTPASLRPSTTGAAYRKKIVYFDGQSHHVVDAPESPGYRWMPPQLTQGDVHDGPQLGVRETPGSVRVKLIGSKFRYLPTMEPGGPCMWSVSPADAAKYGTVGYTDWSAPGAGGKPRPLTCGATSRSSDFVRTQGIGYKEYEAATKMLNGVGSWERTQQHLTASMDVGRPSRLLSAREHMTKTMSASAGFTGLRQAA